MQTKAFWILTGRESAEHKRQDYWCRPFVFEHKANAKTKQLQYILGNSMINRKEEFNIKIFKRYVNHTWRLIDDVILRKHLLPPSGWISNFLQHQASYSVYIWGTYLTDECTEFTRGETIIDAAENRNGYYNVAEETAKVVKGVYPDWEKRGQQLNEV